MEVRGLRAAPLLMPLLDDDAKIHFYEQFDRLRPGRAALWALQRACGLTMRDIATRSGVSDRLVSQELRWAEREGHFDKAQDRLFKLLDKAVDVYEQALEDRSAVKGDKDVARDLLNGAGVLGKHVLVNGGGGDNPNRETFDVWRARFSRPADPSRLAGRSAGALPTGDESDQTAEGRTAPDGEVCDAELVEPVASGSHDPSSPLPD